jgi:pimeloyl-ACP methyl ester carboxylesterase
MERRSFETPLGEIWLWGHAEAFDGNSALVLVIQGAFAAPSLRFHDLEKVLPVCVLASTLPGHSSPRLSETSVPAFAAAYAAALAQVRRERPVVVCGESVGGLVALAMEAPAIALDPPLRTEKLWPLIPFFREQLREDPSQLAFLWNVLGVGTDTLEPRDYRPLLSSPAHIIVGAEPLYPERSLPNGPPSLVDEPERDLMRGSEMIRLTVAPGAGHVIPGNAPALFTDAIREALYLEATGHSP